MYYSLVPISTFAKNVQTFILDNEIEEIEEDLVFDIGVHRFDVFLVSHSTSNRVIYHIFACSGNVVYVD